MQQKKCVRGFVEAMHGFVQQQVTGHIVLIGYSGDWGKIELRNGEIFSLGYSTYHGADALPPLRSQQQIQFMFRPEKGQDVAERHPDNPSQLNNQQFFNFFSDLLPQGGEENLPSGARGLLFPEPATAGQRKRILVVDDSALARKIAARILIDAGYHISEAVDGFDAMGQLESEHPDLVLLDLVMPGIDGYKVVELMKAHQRYRTIPIVMLTSRASLMDKLKGKMSDSDAYITKPVKEAELLMMTARLLGS